MDYWHMSRSHGSRSHMTFYWSKEVTLLFSTWQTNSGLNISLSLLACFVASAFYQYLEDRRLQLMLIATTGGAAKLAGVSSVASQIEEPLMQAKFVEKKWSRMARIAGAVLFGVNSASGYLLMHAIPSIHIHRDSFGTSKNDSFIQYWWKPEWPMEDEKNAWRVATESTQSTTTTPTESTQLTSTMTTLPCSDTTLPSSLRLPCSCWIIKSLKLYTRRKTRAL